MTTERTLPNRRRFVSTSLAGLSLAALGQNTEGADGSTPKVEVALPPLPYANDALMPYLDEDTVRIHHGKHHGGAVKVLKRTLDQMEKALGAQDFSGSKGLCRSLAYYGSSHILHSIFWTNMTPDGGGRPSGALAKRIDQDFGSFDAFRGHFLASSNSAPASGWGLLAYHHGLDRLLILQVEDHEGGTLWGVEPLLACDVWEHAYYLKYQNLRADWTRTFMDHLVHWKDVERRFEHAVHSGA